MTVKQLAEAFSSHRFDEVYDHLADDARWVLPGQDPLVGKAETEAAPGIVTITSYAVELES
jgi:hypothetical protein